MNRVPGTILSAYVACAAWVGLVLFNAAASAGTPNAQEDMAEGGSLYAARCASCHGTQGAGVPGVFPALAGIGAVAAADPTKHITVILNGMQGASVGGVTYAAPMPAFASQLDDQQIAAIVDYERTSWGNHAPTITAKTVADVRAKH
jgi:mono/diheme cytochrome c family protein